MLRTAFRIPLRQAEGLMASVFDMMSLSLAVPDNTTVSRRAAVLPRIPTEDEVHTLIDSTGLKVYGAGQWQEEKHGVRARHDWRKLHLAVDADNFSIVAHTLTDSQTDDPSQAGPLLSQTDGTVTQVTADGAYDGRPTYNIIAGHGEGITVAIPPRATAVAEEITGPPPGVNPGKGTAGLAGCRGIWQTGTGGDDDRRVTKRLLVPICWSGVLRRRRQKLPSAWRY